MAIILQSRLIESSVFITDFERGLSKSGAIASFIGRMRQEKDGEVLRSMTLEHYPKMAQKQIEAIEAEAHQRWALEGSLIVHRYGRILPNETIVFVAAAAAHRAMALDACSFLIDWLKMRAPFWKYEQPSQGEGEWVKARRQDEDRATRWNNNKPIISTD